ncbi:GNAT family N-acetyltransferase [Chondromyces apiculatus]|uniref:GNAT family N-acetyltransferase n=1 Tax=Chondromyces apiculatus TaxID=51 RepID=UPI0006935538|nr:GNAT family N-acetyltransferase [Chondromyces apiculatus]
MARPPRTWEPRRLAFATDQALLRQARAQFYGQSSDAYVDWLYGANPAGPPFCHLAMDGEVIAGQYVVIPIDMVAGGQSFKAALSLDTFTHEDYRRQGIFAGLGEAVLQEAGAAGCRFTIGFPNEKSHHGLTKNLRFEEPFGVYLLVRPLPHAVLGPGLARRLPRPAGALARLAGWRVEAVGAVDAAWVDRLWALRRPVTPIGLEKTGAWFQWRFEENPRASYRYLVASRSDGEPAGVLVWSHDARAGRRPAVNLVDLEAAGYGARAALLAAFLDEVAAEGDAVKALATPGSALGRSLLAAGFVPVRRFPFTYRPHRADEDLRPVLRASTWSISGAYADML